MIQDLEVEAGPSSVNDNEVADTHTLSSIDAADHEGLADVRKYCTLHVCMCVHKRT